MFPIQNQVWLPDTSALAVGCGSSSGSSSSSSGSNYSSSTGASTAGAGMQLDTDQPPAGVMSVLASPMRRWISTPHTQQSNAGAEAIRALKQSFAQCAMGAAKSSQQQQQNPQPATEPCHTSRVMRTRAAQRRATI